MKMKVRILMRMEFMEVPKPMIKKMEKLFEKLESKNKEAKKKRLCCIGGD